VEETLSFVMPVLVIMVVMPIMVVFPFFIPAVSFIDFAVRPVYDLIQFSAVQPHAAALGTKVDFHTLPFGNL